MSTTIPPFDGLSVELLKHGYRRCLIIELRCLGHGFFRVFCHPIESTYSCPRCGEPCEYVSQGEAITRRELPESEFLFDPVPSEDRQVRRISARRRERRLLCEGLSDQSLNNSQVHGFSGPRIANECYE